jgi:hypothetical protein
VSAPNCNPRSVWGGFEELKLANTQIVGHEICSQGKKASERSRLVGIVQVGDGMPNPSCIFIIIIIIFFLISEREDGMYKSTEKGFCSEPLTRLVGFYP